MMKKLMILILYPAIALMNSLNYFKRFATLTIISIIAIGIVIFNLFMSLNQTIQSLEQELKGIELVESITKATQLLQQHRGLSAGALGGIQKMKSERVNKEIKFNAAMNTLENQLSANAELRNECKRIRLEVQKLLAKKLSLSMTEDYSEHTQLIALLLSIESKVIDDYSLILDTQIDTYYLIDASANYLPKALETFGQLRALGTGVLAKKILTQQASTELAGLLAQHSAGIKTLRKNLEKTIHYNHLIEDELKGIFIYMEDTTQDVEAIVSFDILQKNFSTPAPMFYEIVSTEIDSGYQQMYHSLLPTIKKLLNQRLVDAKYRLYFSISLSLFLYLLVCYFAFGTYFSIRRNINKLTSSANAFAMGDLSQRIELDTNDELKKIGTSFNAMADSFVSLLATRSEDDARLRAIFNCSLDAMVQMNSEGRVTGWNNQATAIFGWTVAEVMGGNLHEIIIPERYRTAHLGGMKHFLETGVGDIMNLRFEITALRKNGNEFPIEIYVNPLKLGKQYEFTAFIHDITLRKQNQERLQLADMVYQHSIEGIFMTDVNNQSNYSPQ
jgi:PAS domain S-box-containing protein